MWSKLVFTVCFCYLFGRLDGHRGDSMMDRIGGLPGGGSGGGDGSYESSEEDFEVSDHFNFAGINTFFRNFGDNHQCGGLGRRILKDTRKLFQPNMPSSNRHHLSHHLSRLYSRFAEC